MNESEELVLQGSVVGQATNLGVCNYNTSVHKLKIYNENVVLIVISIRK